MKSIFGLPAHPLFVHAPLVLMPVLAVLAIVVAVAPSWRQRFHVHLLIGAAGLLAMTVLAVRSGQKFDGVLAGIAPTKKHRHLGEATRLWVALLFLSTIPLAVLTRRAGGTDAAKAKPPLVAATVSAVLAVVAVIWMIRTGHEGARIVWTGVIKPKA